MTTHDEIRKRLGLDRRDAYDVLNTLLAEVARLEGELAAARKELCKDSLTPNLAGDLMRQRDDYRAQRNEAFGLLHDWLDALPASCPGLTKRTEDFLANPKQAIRDAEATPGGTNAV